ncbi:MAG: DUF6046 domain-containing protein [Ginsengibacter sp.]
MPGIEDIAPINFKSAPISQIARTINIATLPAPPIQKNPYEGKIQSFTPDKGLYKGSLGTPVMQDITFQSITYTDPESGAMKKTPEIKMINVLFNVNHSSIIVKTQIQGRTGTVKEYIGEDDWQITINGLLLSDNGKTPTKEIIDLKNMVHNFKNMKRTRAAVPVICSYLNNLDIFSIVIEDFAMEQEPGGYSKQAFTITAISDADVLLQIY